MAQAVNMDDRGEVQVFIYGNEVQHMQVLLRPGGALIAAHDALVSCGKHATCVPLPRQGQTLFDALAAALQLRSVRTHAKWVNASAETTTLGISTPSPGNLVQIELADTGPLCMHPQALICATRDVHLAPQTRFSRRNHHPCAHMMLVKAHAASGANGAGNVGSSGGGSGGRGSGTAYLAAGGVAVKKPLRAGEALLVMEACLLGVAETCAVSVPRRSAALGGGGRQNRLGYRMIEVTGPGTVFLQSDAGVAAGRRDPGGGAKGELEARIALGMTLGACLMYGAFNIIFIAMEFAGLLDEEPRNAA
ncbi:mitochondrial biogenesis AIM24-domain-containing protein [Tribonema minus]|uniref:Mitochondrial biogenesis AIM24-domain-containing protein n=1 Tax=Tribonema minus TaxID=303371 RepID=A0A835Z000_9STRA|nr:mitochondrial biogenesis AIM24-domain-containing protein [Tribonema minus]